MMNTKFKHNITLCQNTRSNIIQNTRSNIIQNTRSKSELVCIVDKFSHKNFMHNQNEFNNFIKNEKSIICNWKDLKYTKFYNKNILISYFQDVPPYDSHPIFVNAENIFLNDNYHWFYYYWLNRKIFPMAKKIFINCSINSNINFHIKDDFEIYITPFHYKETKQINNNVKCITYEGFESLIFNKEIVKPEIKTYIDINKE